MAERQRSRKGVDFCLTAPAVESENELDESLHVTRLKDNTNKKMSRNLDRACYVRRKRLKEFVIISLLGLAVNESLVGFI